MKSDKLFAEIIALRDEIEALEYGDELHMLKLKKQFELLVLKIKGSDSHYLKDIANIDFNYHTNFFVFLFYTDVYIYEARQNFWKRGKEELSNLLEQFIQEVKFLTPETEKTQSSVSPKKESLSSNKVFIVYGHDNEMLQSVARFVEKWD